MSEEKIKKEMLYDVEQATKRIIKKYAEKYGLSEYQSMRILADIVADLEQGDNC